ncbi:carbamoyl phosphate synthase, partial [Acinetobacter baumannii]
AAQAIGFPVMLKATAGGGGIGMRVCEDEAAVRAGFAAVARLGQSNFGDAGLFLERYVRRARHVEVQIFGDGQGQVVALGERDCSLQRRN